MRDFSRGGKSRNEVKAVDHDFSSNYVTLFGILDLNNDNVAITLTESKVTADFIVDTIEDYWIHNYLNLWQFLPDLKVRGFLATIL